MRAQLLYQKSEQQSSKTPRTPERLESLGSPPAGPGHGGGCQLSIWGSHVHKAISRPAWAAGKTQCYLPDGEGPSREREVVVIQQASRALGSCPSAARARGEPAPAPLVLLAEVRQAGLFHHLQHPAGQKWPVLRADLRYMIFCWTGFCILFY